MLLRIPEAGQYPCQPEKAADATRCNEGGVRGEFSKFGPGLAFWEPSLLRFKQLAPPESVCFVESSNLLQVFLYKRSEYSSMRLMFSSSTVLLN